MRFAKKSYLQQVFLTDELSYLTCWQATFLDPQLRLEYEGFPVPVRNENCRKCYEDLIETVDGVLRKKLCPFCSHFPYVNSDL